MKPLKIKMHFFVIHRSNAFPLLRIRLLRSLLSVQLNGLVCESHGMCALGGENIWYGFELLGAPCPALRVSRRRSHAR